MNDNIPANDNNQDAVPDPACKTEEDEFVDNLWLALAPLLVFALAFVGYCLFDLSRSEVRHLPKWAWALICIFSVPLGGVVYLTIGRESGTRR